MSDFTRWRKKIFQRLGLRLILNYILHFSREILKKGQPVFGTEVCFKGSIQNGLQIRTILFKKGEVSKKSR